MDPNKHKGRAWTTRNRPWADRLANAWLIRRLIDLEDGWNGAITVTRFETAN